MATKKETTTVVDVPELQLGYFDITLFGETPLICHAWAEKAKMAMLNKQQKKRRLLRKSDARPLNSPIRFTS